MTTTISPSVKTPLGAKDIAQLQQILEHEIELQENYQRALLKERHELRSFHADEVIAQTSKREQLFQEIAGAREARLALVESLAGSRSIQLSELVRARTSGEAQKKLLLRIERLKLLVAETARGAQELGQVATFSLNMVNGCLSTIYGATRSTTTNYTIQGQVKQSYYPMNSRREGVLREA